MMHRFFIVTDGRYNWSVMEDEMDFSIIEYLQKLNNHKQLMIYKLEGRTQPEQTVMLGTLDEIYKTMKGERE